MTTVYFFIFRQTLPADAPNCFDSQVSVLVATVIVNVVNQVNMCGIFGLSLFLLTLAIKGQIANLSLPGKWPLHLSLCVHVCDDFSICGWVPVLSSVVGFLLSYNCCSTLLVSMSKPLNGKAHTIKWRHRRILCIILF